MEAINHGAKNVIKKAWYEVQDPARKRPSLRGKINLKKCDLQKKEMDGKPLRL